jgi:hypothetical protein
MRQANFGLAGRADAAIFGGMANPSDSNKPGGWLVEEETKGNPPLKRYFKVYERDEQKAVELARAYGATGKARAVRRLSVHELTGDQLKPGDVKQHG